MPLIYFYFLRDIFAGYKILVWFPPPFHHVKNFVPLSSDLHCFCEKPVIIHVIVLLYAMRQLFLNIFKILLYL